uniref:Retrovirus-related Pol polyprotein from transposon TNT 1-94-like beta-barrel domain-containing protein n=1 Tax=Trichuris muris TaxID=70415 RepID=A0A5S6QY95_TRIMR
MHQPKPNSQSQLRWMEQFVDQFRCIRSHDICSKGIIGGCHLRVHINSMLEVVCLRRTARVVIDQTETVTALLASLPDSYGTLVTTFEGRDENLLTVDYVIGKMLDKYQRRPERNARSNDASVKAASISRKSRSNGPQKFTAFTTYERARIVKATGEWIIDSGCTKHMTCDRYFFTELRKIDGNVLLATKELTHADGIGSGRVRCRIPDGNVEDITLL